MRLGVDFDGTCVDHRYPRIGQTVPRCLETLRSLVARGHKITLNTMRSGPQLDEAVEWFRDHEIPLHGINQDPVQQTWTDSPKVDADLYIDDKALGCPLTLPEGFAHPVVDWHTVELLINLKEHLA